MNKEQKIAITNVRIFNGSDLSTPTTVVVEGDRIGSDVANAKIVDGQNGVLLPGLIDAHVHCTKLEELHKMARAGITTALDMGCWPPEVASSLRHQRGVTDYRSAGPPLTAPGSSHSRLRSFPEEALVVGKTQAAEFVNRRIAEGSEHIKLVVDVPGPDQETIDAAAEEARKQGRLSVAHALTYETVQMAQKAKVDVLTHVPIDKAMTAADVQAMVDEKRSCIPTMTMMEKAIDELQVPKSDYSNCQESVRLMHEAGIPILAGTDSNAIPDSPAHLEHGMSIHRELELLVEAGVSPVEALQSVTSKAAMQFYLDDRGVIAPGYRADLVLIDGDPTKDIRESRRIRRVWCGGVEVV